jgi:hypothetical protein
VIDVYEGKTSHQPRNIINDESPPPVSIPIPGTVDIPIQPAIAPPVMEKTVTKIKPGIQLDGEKRIFVRCERCERTLKVNVPRKIVLENNLEVVPVSIVHGNETNKHVLTVYLDPDFKSRRDKVSDVLFLEE